MNSKIVKNISGSNMLFDNDTSDIGRLKEALRVGISLHTRLKDAIYEERQYLNDIDYDKLKNINDLTAGIKHDIECNNVLVEHLFEQYYVPVIISDIEIRKEIDALVVMLKNAMREALKAVGEALMSVKQARSGVVNDMRDLNDRKSAVKSYAVYNY